MEKVDVNSINLGLLKEIIIEHLGEDSPNAIMIKGAAGVGKSAIVRQALAHFATGDSNAKFTFKDGLWIVGEGEKAYGFIDMRLSQVEPQDLAGIPIPENGITKRFLPDNLPLDLPSHSHIPPRGVLFLDEINQADMSVQKAMFSLILDKKVADVPFKKGWVIIAAGNDIEDSNAVIDFAEPLKNRFEHYVVSADFETWKDWAVFNIHPSVYSFLTNNMHYFCQKHSSEMEDSFPTPRSWSMLSKHIARWSLEKQERSRAYKIARISACVGRAAGESYLAFLDMTESINVEELFEGKKLKIFSQEDAPDAFLHISALLSYVHTKKSQEAVSKLIKFVCNSKMFSKVAEYAIVLLSDVVKIYPDYFVEATMSLSKDEINNISQVCEFLFKAKERI